MTLADLIRRVRTDANDMVEPYFWSDQDVADWLNDAVREAAVRGRLIHESQADAV
ncbi:phage adaptor protein, partial [Pseudomonas aeruginosa]